MNRKSKFEVIFNWFFWFKLYQTFFNEYDDVQWDHDNIFWAVCYSMFKKTKNKNKKDKNTHKKQNKTKQKQNQKQKQKTKTKQKQKQKPYGIK